MFVSASAPGPKRKRRTGYRTARVGARLPGNRRGVLAGCGGFSAGSAGFSAGGGRFNVGGGLRPPKVAGNRRSETASHFGFDSVRQRPMWEGRSAPRQNAGAARLSDACFPPSIAAGTAPPTLGRAGTGPDPSRWRAERIGTCENRLRTCEKRSGRCAKRICMCAKWFCTPLEPIFTCAKPICTPLKPFCTRAGRIFTRAKPIFTGAERIFTRMKRP